MAQRILVYNIALIVIALITLSRYWSLKTQIANHFRTHAIHAAATAHGGGTQGVVDIDDMTLPAPLPTITRGSSPSTASSASEAAVESSFTPEEHTHHKPTTEAPVLPKCANWSPCNEMVEKYRIVAGQTWGKAEHNPDVKSKFETLHCNSCYPKPVKEQHRHKKKWVPATGFGGRNTMALVFDRQIDLKKRAKGDTWFGILLPMTTAFGDEVRDYTELIFWEKLWPSFLQFTSKSLLDASNPYVYTFMIGYDNGDPILDDSKQMNLIHQRMMKELKDRKIPTWKVGVMAYALNDTQGAPSWAVSHIAQAAYDLGIDYMYQINDDTAMASEGWEKGLTSLLQRQKNVGVTGPHDSSNQRILTQSFVHRTHVEIFDAYFSKEFKNWFSDDWLSSVYGDRFTYREHDVRCKHHIQRSRYEVDETAREYLTESINAGQSKIKEYLRSHPDLGLTWD